jgi:hypothetical protein
MLLVISAMALSFCKSGSPDKTLGLQDHNLTALITEECKKLDVADSISMGMDSSSNMIFKTQENLRATIHPFTLNDTLGSYSLVTPISINDTVFFHIDQTRNDTLALTFFDKSDTHLGKIVFLALLNLGLDSQQMIEPKLRFEYNSNISLTQSSYCRCNKEFVVLTVMTIPHVNPHGGSENWESLMFLYTLFISKDGRILAFNTSSRAELNSKTYYIKGMKHKPLNFVKTFLQL